MLNDIAAPSPAAMPFRGYAVLGSQGGSQEVQQVLAGKRPLWFICSGEPRPHPAPPQVIPEGRMGWDCTALP